MRNFCPLATGLKKFNRNFSLRSGIIISFILFFIACAKDPDNLGRDLLPSSDDINVKVDSTTLISAYTITGKQILSSANELYILGSLKDSIFGYGSASLLTQFHPAILMSADSARTVDSLILFISPAGNYGDTLSQMTMRIFELNQPLQLDTNYFSNINPAEYYTPAAELASGTFTPNDTLIRIKITNTDFLNKFEATPDSVFKDLSDFRDRFYGLYISVDQVTEKGGYSYLNMSSLDSRLTMYYNGDTLSHSYEMAFTTLAAKANVFTHDYTGFPVSGTLDSPDSKDTVMYVEGLAGTSSRISFPELEDWKLKGLITINKAELILPVDTLLYPSLSKNNFPPKLLLFSLGEDESYEYLYDYRIDQSGTYYDGNYDNTKNAYVFNIALHLQSYLSGKIENSDMILVSRKSNSAANRVILKSPTAKKSPMKLKVIYTELF